MANISIHTDVGKKTMTVTKVVKGVTEEDVYVFDTEEQTIAAGAEAIRIVLATTSK